MSGTSPACRGHSVCVASGAQGFRCGRWPPPYPQSETESAAQIPTSFGGLVFMMTTIAPLAAVIVVEAILVYGYLRDTFKGLAVRVTPTIIGAFGLVAAICTGATVIPLRVGLGKMESFEF